MWYDIGRSCLALALSSSSSSRGCLQLVAVSCIASPNPEPILVRPIIEQFYGKDDCNVAAVVVVVVVEVMVVVRITSGGGEVHPHPIGCFPA